MNLKVEKHKENDFIKSDTDFKHDITIDNLSSDNIKNNPADDEGCSKEKFDFEKKFKEAYEYKNTENFNALAKKFSEIAEDYLTIAKNSIPVKSSNHCLLEDHIGENIAFALILYNAAFTVYDDYCSLTDDNKCHKNEISKAIRRSIDLYLNNIKPYFDNSTIKEKETDIFSSWYRDSIKFKVREVDVESELSLKNKVKKAKIVYKKEIKKSKDKSEKNTSYVNLSDWYKYKEHEQNQLMSYLDESNVNMADLLKKKFNVKFIKCVEKTFSNNTRTISDFVNESIIEIINYLGIKTNFYFEFCGMGSFARYEITNSSDLESFILTDKKLNPSEELYLKVLTRLLFFKFINLGKTAIPLTLAAKLSFDDIIKPGIQFDLGGKTPLGRRNEKYKLIQTPEDMAEYVKSKYFKESRLLPIELRTSSSIYKSYENLDLHKVYRKKVDEILNEKKKRDKKHESIEQGCLSEREAFCETVGKTQAIKLLSKDVLLYSPKFLKARYCKNPYDVKVEFYRFTDRIIEGLALYFDVDVNSSWDRIKAIYKKIRNVVSSETNFLDKSNMEKTKKDALKAAENNLLKAVTAANLIRSIAYSQKKSQVKFIENIEEKLHFQFYQVAVKLYKFINDFLISDHDKRVKYFCSEKFCEYNENKVKGFMYIRRDDQEKSIQFFNEWISGIEKNNQEKIYALYLRAITYIAMGNKAPYHSAKSDLEKVKNFYLNNKNTKEHPNLIDIYINFARLECKFTNNYDLMFSYYEEANKIADKNYCGCALFEINNDIFSRQYILIRKHDKLSHDEKDRRGFAIMSKLQQLHDDESFYGCHLKKMKNYFIKKEKKIKWVELVGPRGSGKNSFLWLYIKKMERLYRISNAERFISNVQDFSSLLDGFFKENGCSVPSCDDVFGKFNEFLEKSKSFKENQFIFIFNQRKWDSTILNDQSVQPNIKNQKLLYNFIHKLFLNMRSLSNGDCFPIQVIIFARQKYDLISKIIADENIEDDIVNYSRDFCNVELKLLEEDEVKKCLELKWKIEYQQGDICFFEENVFKKAAKKICDKKLNFYTFIMSHYFDINLFVKKENEVDKYLTDCKKDFIEKYFIAPFFENIKNNKSNENEIAFCMLFILSYFYGTGVSENIIIYFIKDLFNLGAIIDVVRYMKMVVSNFSYISILKIDNKNYYFVDPVFKKCFKQYIATTLKIKRLKKILDELYKGFDDIYKNFDANYIDNIIDYDDLGDEKNSKSEDKFIEESYNNLSDSTDSNSENNLSIDVELILNYAFIYEKLCAKVYSIPNSIPKDERDDIFLSLKKLINAIQVCWYSKWRQYTLLLIDLFDYCSKQFTTIPLFKEEKIKDYVSSIKNNIFLIFAGFFSKLLEGKPSKIYAPIILYGKYSFFYKCLDDSLSLDSKDKVRILEKIESALEDEFSKNKYLELIMSASLNDIHDRKVVFINQSKKEGVNEKNAMPFIFIAKVKNIFESRIFMEYIRSFISKNEEAIAKEKEPMETVLAPEIFTYKFISEFLSKNNKWSHHRANNENSLEKNVGFDKHVKAKGAEYLYGVKRIKEDYFSPDRPSSALAKIEHFPFNKQK